MAEPQEILEVIFRPLVWMYQNCLLRSSREIWSKSMFINVSVNIFQEKIRILSKTGSLNWLPIFLVYIIITYVSGKKLFISCKIKSLVKTDKSHRYEEKLWQARPIWFISPRHNICHIYGFGSTNKLLFIICFNILTWSIDHVLKSNPRWFRLTCRWTWQASLKIETVFVHVREKSFLLQNVWQDRKIEFISIALVEYSQEIKRAQIIVAH